MELEKVATKDLKLTQLQDWVARLDLRDLAIEDYICFRCENYQRQILYRDSNCEIIVVCWQPGQSSPIHDHGDCLNVTRVYRGTLTSRTYILNNKFFPLLEEEKDLQANELVGVDYAQIHQLANTSNQNLITLNVYVKPLQQMKVYDLTQKQWQFSNVTANNQKRLIDNPAQSKGFPSKKKTIAIIGGGFSGSMVAVHLLKNAVSNLQIKLIESRPLVGEGIAYSTNWDGHLLNVPTGKMSAFAKEQDHFWDWLQTRESGISKDDFVSRKVYGEYIRSILAKAEAGAIGVNLERLTCNAIALKTDAQQATIYFNNGKSIEADQVVLAWGNFPPADPQVADPAFYQSNRYFRFWSTPSRLAAIPADQGILIIGSGLSAIDAILALEEQKHRGQIYVVSRHGLFPQAHTSTTPYPFLFESQALPTKISSLMRQIRQEIATAQIEGSNWQSVINSLRPHTQVIWQSLAIAEKQRFLRHLRSYWEIHRHRVSSVIHQRLDLKMAAGQLHLIAGRIQAYNENSQGVNVSIRQRCSKDILNLPVGVVINCAGSQSNYRQLEHPLVNNLLNSGLIKPDPLNLGLEVAANGALINSAGEISNLLFTLGSPLKGCLWETTAVAEIRQQAQTLAQQLLTLQSKERIEI